jgi:hypothetical protein
MRTGKARREKTAQRQRSTSTGHVVDGSYAAAFQVSTAITNLLTATYDAAGNHRKRLPAYLPITLEI